MKKILKKSQYCRYKFPGRFGALTGKTGRFDEKLEDSREIKTGRVAIGRYDPSVYTSLVLLNNNQ